MKALPCFIINLEQDTSKKENMKAECIKASLTPTFTKAVYGVDLSEKKIDEVYNADKSLHYFQRELTKGEIGTALSHLNIYSKILKESLPYALVLEDDINIPISEKELSTMITKLPSDWEVLLLGHHTGRSRNIDTLSSRWNKSELSKTHNCIRFAENAFGAYAYIINLSGAKKLLKQFNTIDRPIDHWNDNYVNLYGVFPSIIHVYETPNESLLSIERKRSVTQRTLYQKFKDSIQNLLKTLHLIKIFYLIKNFFNQFKHLDNYKNN